MLGTAGAGDIYVAEGVGKVVRRTGAKERRITNAPMDPFTPYWLAQTHVPVYESRYDIVRVLFFFFLFFFAGPTRGNAEPSGNKERSITQRAVGEANKVSPGEGRGRTIRKPKTPRKARGSGRAGGTARKKTVADVGLTATRRKREAKRNARDMLKSARGLAAKGRWNG